MIGMTSRNAHTRRIQGIKWQQGEWQTRTGRSSTWNCRQSQDRAQRMHRVGARNASRHTVTWMSGYIDHLTWDWSAHHSDPRLLVQGPNVVWGSCYPKIAWLHTSRNPSNSSPYELALIPSPLVPQSLRWNGSRCRHWHNSAHCEFYCGTKTHFSYNHTTAKQILLKRNLTNKVQL